jgi:hypothetical protein
VAAQRVQVGGTGALGLLVVVLLSGEFRWRGAQVLLPAR